MCCCYILLFVGVVLLRVVCCVLIVRCCLFCCFPFCSVLYCSCAVLHIGYVCAIFFCCPRSVRLFCFVASGGLNIPSINPTQPSELFQSYFIFAPCVCLFALPVCFVFVCCAVCFDDKSIIRDKKKPTF